jgi:dimethylamine monooxygenase subunit A
VSDATAQRTIDWLTPAERMPWTVSTPFRMRPNLEKLDPESPALLLYDDLAPAYARERARVLRDARERACVGTANGDIFEAMRDLIPSPLRGEGAPAGAGEGDISENGDDFLSIPLSRRSAPPSPSRGEGNSLEAPPTDTNSVALSLQEDFVILKHENDRLTTEYLSVCFPSRWDPREKLGLDFSQIHAPVADNQMLLAAGANIMTMAFMKQPMLRHVWLIVPSASLPQHPDQNDYSWAETLRDPSPLLPRLFFRVERQTTWPLPQFNRAVFFIRVMMSPLVDVLRVSDSARPEPSEGARAKQLASALRSMTPAVVAYRGMTDAMPRLLAELDVFAQDTMRNTD